MNAAQNACGGGVRFRDLPQRQRFPQFTAVAEKGEAVNAAQNACGGGVVEAVCVSECIRNGSIFRDSVPLRKRGKR